MSDDEPRATSSTTEEQNPTPSTTLDILRQFFVPITAPLETETPVPLHQQAQLDESLTGVSPMSGPPIGLSPAPTELGNPSLSVG